MNGQTCGECGLFDHSKGKAGKCDWGIADCKGPKSRHAGFCPLFMDSDGRQWLLDCNDDELPDWAYSDQDLPIANSHETARI